MNKGVLALLLGAVLPLLTCGHDALTSQDRTESTSLTAANIDRLIQSKGAKAVLSELSEDADRWSAVLDMMATGKADWLRIMVSFYGVSDGGTALDLQIVAAEALQNDPATVLEILDEPFTLEVLCGNENSLGETLSNSLKIIHDRRKAVAGVKVERLERSKLRCLALLDELEKAAVKNAESWFPQ